MHEHAPGQGWGAPGEGWGAPGEGWGAPGQGCGAPGEGGARLAQVRNNNSSRFGKYVALSFDERSQLLGAEVHTSPHLPTPPHTSLLSPEPEP